jgi:hypothetical protein
LKRKEKKTQRKLNSDRQKESDMPPDMGEKIQFSELEFSTITDTENPGVTITESLARIFECTAQADEYDYSRLKPMPLSCENGGVNTGEKKPIVGYMLFCKHNHEAAKKMLPSSVESKGIMPAIAKILCEMWGKQNDSNKAMWTEGKIPKGVGTTTQAWAFSNAFARPPAIHESNIENEHTHSPPGTDLRMDWADACSLGSLPDLNRYCLLILDKGTEYWLTFPTKT